MSSNIKKLISPPSLPTMCARKKPREIAEMVRPAADDDDDISTNATTLVVRRSERLRKANAPSTAGKLHKCYFCRIRSCCGGRTTVNKRIFWRCSQCQKKKQNDGGGGGGLSIGQYNHESATISIDNDGQPSTRQNQVEARQGGASQNECGGGGGLSTVEYNDELATIPIDNEGQPPKRQNQMEAIPGDNPQNECDDGGLSIGQHNEKSATIPIENDGQPAKRQKHVEAKQGGKANTEQLRKTLNTVRGQNKMANVGGSVAGPSHTTAKNAKKRKGRNKNNAEGPKLHVNPSQDYMPPKIVPNKNKLYRVKKICAFYKSANGTNCYYLDWAGFPSSHSWALSQDCFCLERCAKFGTEMGIDATLRMMTGEEVPDHLAKMMEKNSRFATVCDQYQPPKMVATKGSISYEDGIDATLKEKAKNDLPAFLKMCKLK